MKRNAESIGIIVHPQKTQLLCFSLSHLYEVEIFIRDGRDQNSGSPTLKELGVTFDQRLNFNENVRLTRRKYRAKSWTLRHLKQLEILTPHLSAIYKIYFRTILEYNIPAYGMMMTQECSSSPLNPSLTRGFQETGFRRDPPSNIG